MVIGLARQGPPTDGTAPVKRRARGFPFVSSVSSSAFSWYIVPRREPPNWNDPLDRLITSNLFWTLLSLLAKHTMTMDWTKKKKQTAMTPAMISISCSLLQHIIESVHSAAPSFKTLSSNITQRQALLFICIVYISLRWAVRWSFGKFQRKRTYVTDKVGSNLHSLDL